MTNRQIKRGNNNNNRSIFNTGNNPLILIFDIMKNYTKAVGRDGSEYRAVDANHWGFYNSLDLKRMCFACKVERQTKRGVTLTTYAIAGERLTFTLKPSLWELS